MQKIYVVGIGPGSIDDMTYHAVKALQTSSIIIGYTYYITLIQDIIKDKQIITTPMKGEITRCQAAVDNALAGHTVAVVSSGDAGIYGMSGLIHQLCANHPDIDIEVIPGITACCSGAAVLGAPLTHDFAVISLSDLLTPWHVIENRLLLASQADFTICLYNPSSKKRADYLKKACACMLQFKSPNTPCGYVKNISRTGQQSVITTLEELQNCTVDMFTTVFIGSSKTIVVNGKLVTPRGYNV